MSAVTAADQPRPDVAAAFPSYGANHGFTPPHGVRWAVGKVYRLRERDEQQRDHLDLDRTRRRRRLQGHPV